eukprot:7379215-Prymnesium_polylepis.2
MADANEARPVGRRHLVGLHAAGDAGSPSCGAGDAQWLRRRHKKSRHQKRQKCRHRLSKHQAVAVAADSEECPFGRVGAATAGQVGAATVEGCGECDPSQHLEVAALGDDEGCAP